MNFQPVLMGAMWWPHSYGCVVHMTRHGTTCHRSSACPKPQCYTMRVTGLGLELLPWCPCQGWWPCLSSLLASLWKSLTTLTFPVAVVPHCVVSGSSHVACPTSIKSRPRAWSNTVVMILSSWSTRATYSPPSAIGNDPSQPWFL